MMPAYILKCLEADIGQDEIAKMFPEDGELVRMWVMFLTGNHWARRVPLDGHYGYEKTEKGKEWISRYNF